MLKKIVVIFFSFSLCMSIVMVIIPLYSSKQLTFSHLYRRQLDTTLQRNNMSLKSPNRSSQYIWCVNHYGPNNQIRDFVKCCILAMVNNYTLIIPPLFPHYGDVDRGIQWFDHLYDLKQLSRVLNIITLDEFVPKLKIKQKKSMIDCYAQQTELVADRSWYSKNALISIQNHYKISFDFYHYVNLSRSSNMDELFAKTKTCSSIFLHVHYTTFRHFFSSPNKQLQQVFESLRRTVLIQRMSSQLIKLLPQLVNKKNHSKNNLTILAVIHMRLGDHIVMSVAMYIKQILYLIKSGVRFTHLHIMCPYLNSSDTRQLTENLPIVFTTTQDLSYHVRFVLDNYLFNVLEQEIAYQSPIFMASPWTTYSATVLMQKVYQGKGTVYILSSKGDGRPVLVTKKNVKYFEK